MLHGLFTNLHHNFAAELAEKLAQTTGLCVYRFDFRQHTDPGYIFPGFPEDVADVQRVVDALSERGLRTAGIIGHSKGANVALMYAAQAAELGVLLPTVALAPRFYMAGMPTFIFSPEDLSKLREGSPEESLAWTPHAGGEIRVTQRMLDDILAIDMGAVVSRIPPSVPILLAHGRKDKTIPVVDADAFVAARPSIEKHIFKTGHVFSDDRGKMISLVIEWVTRHCCRGLDGEKAARAGDGSASPCC